VRLVWLALFFLQPNPSSQSLCCSYDTVCHVSILPWNVHQFAKHSRAPQGSASSVARQNVGHAKQEAICGNRSYGLGCVLSPQTNESIMTGGNQKRQRAYRRAGIELPDLEMHHRYAARAYDGAVHRVWARTGSYIPSQDSNAVVLRGGVSFFSGNRKDQRRYHALSHRTGHKVPNLRAFSFGEEMQCPGSQTRCRAQ
jgi:hypothetical protein